MRGKEHTKNGSGTAEVEAPGPYCRLEKKTHEENQAPLSHLMLGQKRGAKTTAAGIQASSLAMR